MSSAVAVLTAMITPAVLISACGSMILSTSSRLGRVVDRVRALSDKLEELAQKRAEDTKERQGVIFAQLDKLTSRARILQRSMVAFYLATGMFVATSVAIGVVAVIPSSPDYNLVPVIVGLGGACCLFYGSMLLIFEARLALSTIHAEMDFTWAKRRELLPQMWWNTTNRILYTFAVTSRDSDVSDHRSDKKPARLFTTARDRRAREAGHGA
jgi:hypothetical protein